MSTVDAFGSQEAVLSAATGNVVCDSEGTILFVSRQIEKTFGYQSAELVGRTVDELLSSALLDQSAPPSESGAIRASSRLTATRRNGSEVAIDVVRTVLERGEDRLTIVSIAEVSEPGEFPGRAVQTT